MGAEVLDVYQTRPATRYKTYTILWWFHITSEEEIPPTPHTYRRWACRTRAGMFCRYLRGVWKSGDRPKKSQHFQRSPHSSGKKSKTLFHYLGVNWLSGDKVGTTTIFSISEFSHRFALRINIIIFLPFCLWIPVWTTATETLTYVNQL